MIELIFLFALVILPIAIISDKRAKKSCTKRKKKKHHHNDVKCYFVRNYDGDTITVNIPEWPDIVGKNISVRICGIDTPEIKGTSGETKEKALAAKQVVFDICSNAKKIELRNVQKDKYFRLLADVYVDGKSIGKTLLNKGLAKPYFGKTKNLW